MTKYYRVHVGRKLLNNVFKYDKINMRFLRYLSVGRSVLYPVPNERSQRNNYVSGLLGVSVPTAAKWLQYYDKVSDKSLQDIQVMVHTLEELGMRKSDIAKNFKVLGLSSTDVRLRYACLKELGFEVIECAELVCYNSIVGLNSKTLLEQGIIPQKTCPVSNVMKLLKCPPHIEEAIAAHCSNAEEMQLQELRVKIMILVLAHFLSVSDSEAQTIIDTCKYLQNGSLISMKRVLEIYLQEVGLDSGMIRQFPHLLTVMPSSIIKLTEIGEMYHFDTKRILSECPAIALSDPVCVEHVCRTLVDYEIPLNHLVNQPSVLLLTPQFVSDALVTLHGWPEFPILKSHPKFLSVIKCYKKANFYMGCLKKAGFKRCNIELLIAPDKKFKQHLYSGEDCHSCREMIAFLSEKLGYGHTDIESKLRYHPSFTKTSLMRMSTTLAFLFDRGFTKSQIYNGLALVLYSKRKVAKAWAELPTLDFVQPFSDWQNSSNVLQLLLYVIEKGEGVFLKPEDAPEVDKKADQTRN